MSGIGLPELLIVLIIVLVVFGRRRLPELGRQLGSGMREFRDAIARRHADEDAEADSRSTAPAALERPEEPVDGEVVAERDR